MRKTPKKKYFSGYIEGYYGRRLSSGRRESIVDLLGDWGMNTYIYAPKEDRYHRRDWKIPYPSEWEKSFASFVHYAEKNRVSVVPCIAPGLTYDYLSAEHFKLLMKKIERFIALGASTVALLMDDISEKLPSNCRKKYSSLGEAHGILLQKISEKTNKSATSLWFCPTVYCDEFSEVKLSQNLYLQTLSKSIPENIPILWTGPNVVSQKIDSSTLSSIRSFFGDNILIWDNLYANDYCPMKLFFGPYTGRSTNLPQITSGMLLNPTGLFETDKFLLTLMGNFLRGESAPRGWRGTSEEFKLPKEIQAIRYLFDSPFIKLDDSKLTLRKRKRSLDILYRLIFDWKGPMHDEWYPFLYQAWVDLQTPEKISDDLWLTKKYPPTTAYLLRR